MDDTFDVPITVHCAIPITERKRATLGCMAPPRKIPPPEEDTDETLAANFVALMGDRSVGQLRKEMADRGMTIGSGAIQAAKQGSRGIRLETLQKFADFFGCEVNQLLRSGDAEDASWPFPRLTPTEFASLNEDIKAAAEDMLLAAAKRAASGEQIRLQAGHKRTGT